MKRPPDLYDIFVNQLDVAVTCGSTLATLASCLWNIDNSATVTVKSLTVLVLQDILVLLQWKTGQLSVNYTGSSVYSFSLIKCKIMMRISVTPTGAKKSKKNVVWWLSVDWSSPWAHVYKWSLSYLYVYSELNRLFWHAVTSFSHWLMFAIETGSAVRSILSLSAQKTWCERKSGCSYIRGYVIVVLL